MIGEQLRSAIRRVFGFEKVLDGLVWWAVSLIASFVVAGLIRLPWYSKAGVGFGVFVLLLVAGIRYRQKRPPDPKVTLALEPVALDRQLDPVRLRITNTGRRRKFEAQVVEIGGELERPPLPWLIRWHHSHQLQHEIGPGDSYLLDLAIPKIGRGNEPFGYRFLSPTDETFVGFDTRGIDKAEDLWKVYDRPIVIRGKVSEITRRARSTTECVTFYARNYGHTAALGRAGGVELR